MGPGLYRWVGSGRDGRMDGRTGKATTGRDTVAGAFLRCLPARHDHTEPYTCHAGSSPTPSTLPLRLGGGGRRREDGLVHFIHFVAVQLCLGLCVMRWSPTYSLSFLWPWQTQGLAGTKTGRHSVYSMACLPCANTSAHTLACFLSHLGSSPCLYLPSCLPARTPLSPSSHMRRH